MTISQEVSSRVNTHQSIESTLTKVSTHQSTYFLTISWRCQVKFAQIFLAITLLLDIWIPFCFSEATNISINSGFLQKMLRNIYWTCRSTKISNATVVVLMIIPER